MYYSVFKGFNKGIYKSWKECEKEVKGYKGAIYKKFKLENDAILFLNNGLEKKEESNIMKVYTDGSCINNDIRKEGYKCGFCNLKKPTPKSILEHEKLVHGCEKSYYCAFCPFRAKSSQILEQHYRHHEL